MAALAENKNATLAVTMDGRVYNVVVPWGAEEVALPDSGEIIKVAWAQDDEGALVYSHHEYRGVREVNIVSGGSRGKICGCC